MGPIPKTATKLDWTAIPYQTGDARVSYHAMLRCVRQMPGCAMAFEEDGEHHVDA